MMDKRQSLRGHSLTDKEQDAVWGAIVRSYRDIEEDLGREGFSSTTAYLLSREYETHAVILQKLNLEKYIKMVGGKPGWEPPWMQEGKS
jgi:hypothetical protein